MDWWRTEVGFHYRGGERAHERLDERAETLAGTTNQVDRDESLTNEQTQFQFVQGVDVL